MRKHRLTAEELECLRGCSTYPHYYKMRKGFENGICPFCSPDLTFNTIEFQNTTWIAWQVPPSLTTRRKTLALQLVIFPKAHVRRLDGLSMDQWIGLQGVIQWMYREHNIPGGAFFARIGDMRYNVGTVPHVHFNLFVPSRKGEVIIPLQKSKGLWKEHQERMLAFAERYAHGEIPPYA